MNPLTSERNLTPSSTAFVSVSLTFAGTAVAGQILIGPLCAPARVAAPASSAATATVAVRRGRLPRAQAKRAFMYIGLFLSGRDNGGGIGARARAAGSRRAINGQTTSAYFWGGSSIGEQKYRNRSP